MKPDELSTLFQALADETRLRILTMLSDREACVCEIMDALGMAQSKLSHHLIILRKAGFLSDEKRGKWNYYRIEPGSLGPVQRSILQSLPRWTGNERTLEADRQRLKRSQQALQVPCCPPKQTTSGKASS